MRHFTIITIITCVLLIFFKCLWLLLLLQHILLLHRWQYKFPWNFSGLLSLKSCDNSTHCYVEFVTAVCWVRSGPKCNVSLSSPNFWFIIVWLLSHRYVLFSFHFFYFSLFVLVFVLVSSMIAHHKKKRWNLCWTEWHTFFRIPFFIS